MKPNLAHYRKPKWFILLPLVAAGVWLFVRQAYTARNYEEQNFPVYSGSYANESVEPVETLTVVSYNIWFGEDIDQAILDINEIQSQRGLDILLLQEMDETGTEQVARELQMDYVYFPAAIEPTYDQNFGNAILSRWPIVDARKMILPHKSLSNRMNRIATRATIQMEGADILVYNVHSESIFTLPRFREDQYRAVLNDMNPDSKYVIVGGDFNSLTQADVDKVEQSFKQAGFTRASEKSGGTIVKLGLEFPSDHIFIKGFAVNEAGKLQEAAASDHMPLWVTLMLQ